MVPAISDQDAPDSYSQGNGGRCHAAGPDEYAFRSFPFDGGWRFAGYVIDHAIDSGDFVHDTGRDSAEQFIVNANPIGGYKIGAPDETQGGDVLIRVAALVAHHPDGAHGYQYRKRLGDLGISSSRMDFLEGNGVYLTERFQPGSRDRSDELHGQSGPGKGRTF